MSQRILASVVVCSLSLAGAAHAVTRTVTLTMTGNPNAASSFGCSVNPAHLVIDVSDTVQFKAATSATGQVTAALKKGQSSNVKFGNQTSFTATNAAPATTPAASGSGDWPYTVTFVDGGSTICTIDPDICIRGTGGCTGLNEEPTPTPSPTPTPAPR